MSDMDYIVNVLWIILENLLLVLFSAFIVYNLMEMLYAKIGWYADISTYYISMAILTVNICVKTFVDMEKLNDLGE